MNYTKEVLEPLVLESFSISEVMRKLGLKCLTGGQHSHITRQIKKFGINTSHLLGKGANQGSRHIGGPDKLLWKEILVKDRLNGRKELTEKLRRAMLESGINHACGTCGIEPIWNGKLLILQISHKDGNSLNNERSNLHFECPNCHSQTDDFGGRSARKKNFLLRGNVKVT